MRPAKTASMKGRTRISKTPEAKTKTFQGAGGGSMEGIMTARNSWRSNRVRNCSKRSRLMRLSRKSSPPARPRP